MRKLIATVFNYSLDGLLADEGTEFWKFCFDLPEIREPDDPARLDFLQSAYAHIMGRTAYEAISRSMTTMATDHPFADILNAGRKVVFFRTLKTAEWANTTIAAGDTAEEIDKLRRGGDGHIVVWGGVSLWRSLMRLDLIDELQLSLFPYVAGEGIVIAASPLLKLAEPLSRKELHHDRGGRNHVDVSRRVRRRRERRGRRSFRLVLLGRRRGLHSEHEIGHDVPRLGAERRPPEGLAG
jgi:dihydrofolate reductase